MKGDPWGILKGQGWYTWAGGLDVSARSAHPPLLSPWPWQVPTVCVLRRSPEGAPVQVFVPENGEIISQV